MATPVNAEAFEKPHWRLVAEGFNWQELDIYFSARGGMVERNGGIESPTVQVDVGTYYYRFVDLKAGADNQQGGGWWLDLDQLTKIMLACPSRGLNLSQSRTDLVLRDMRRDQPDQHRQGRGADLSHHAVSVVLYRALADSQFGSNVLGCLPCHHVLDHLPFTPG